MSLQTLKIDVTQLFNIQRYMNSILDIVLNDIINIIVNLKTEQARFALHARELHT